MKSLVIALLFIFSIGQSLEAQTVSQPRSGATGSWRYLGMVQAALSADHDAIYVKGPYDYFRKIKFKVTDAGLNLNRLIVRYDDGGLPEEVSVRQDIPQGGESRVIDLKGGKRKLKSVEFWYDTKGILNGRADVSLMGIK